MLVYQRVNRENKDSFKRIHTFPTSHSKPSNDLTLLQTHFVFWLFHTFLGGATLMPPKITFMISRFMASSNGRKVFIAKICQHFVPCKCWQFFTASKWYHNCSLDSVVHCQHLPTEKRQETLEQKSHASFSESTWGSLHTWSWSEWHLMAIQRWYHSKAMLWCLWIWESQKSQYLWRVTTSGNSTHLFETMGRWLEILPQNRMDEKPWFETNNEIPP